MAIVESINGCVCVCVCAFILFCLCAYACLYHLYVFSVRLSVRLCYCPHVRFSSCLSACLHVFIRSPLCADACLPIFFLRVSISARVHTGVCMFVPPSWPVCHFSVHGNWKNIRAGSRESGRVMDGCLLCVDHILPFFLPRGLLFPPLSLPDSLISYIYNHSHIFFLYLL